MYYIFIGYSYEFEAFTYLNSSQVRNYSYFELQSYGELVGMLFSYKQENFKNLLLFSRYCKPILQKMKELSESNSLPDLFSDDNFNDLLSDTMPKYLQENVDINIMRELIHEVLHELYKINNSVSEVPKVFGKKSSEIKISQELGKLLYEIELSDFMFYKYETGPEIKEEIIKVRKNLKI